MRRYSIACGDIRADLCKLRNQRVESVAMRKTWHNPPPHYFYGAQHATGRLVLHGATAARLNAAPSVYTTVPYVTPYTPLGPGNFQPAHDM